MSTHIHTVRATFWGVLAALALVACGKSAQRVCEESCDQDFECKLNGISSDNALELCIANCVPESVEIEQRLEDGRLTEECYDAQIDYENCVNDLNCSDLRRGLLGDCEDLDVMRSEKCAPGEWRGFGARTFR